MLFSSKGEFIPPTWLHGSLNPTNNRNRQGSENRIITFEGELSIGIGLPTYKMVYERATEDVISVETDRVLFEDTNRQNESKLLTLKASCDRGYF